MVLVRYEATASKTPAVMSQNLADAWTKPDGIKVDMAWMNNHSSTSNDLIYMKNGQ